MFVRTAVKWTINTKHKYVYVAQLMVYRCIEVEWLIKINAR